MIKLDIGDTFTLYKGYLLNGECIATIIDISSIENWSSGLPELVYTLIDESGQKFRRTEDALYSLIKENHND